MAAGSLTWPPEVRALMFTPAGEALLQALHTLVVSAERRLIETAPHSHVTLEDIRYTSGMCCALTMVRDSLEDLRKDRA